MNTNMDIKLTIGIPSIPERMSNYLSPFYKKLMDQIGDSKDIEVISLMDNKVMSIGRKKNILFSLAQGKYTCVIDDDDDVVDDFIETLRNSITRDLDVDVICYNQEAIVDGKKWIVRTNLDHNKIIPFDQLQKDTSGNPIPCNRPPWQWCAWRTDFIKQISFENISWGEDAVFIAEASTRAKTQLVLDKIMCKYKWDSQVSAAPHQPIPQSILNRVNSTLY